MLLQFNVNEYKTMIRMSGRRHLLVEGRGDKRLFKQLLLGFQYDKNSIEIDSAEELIGFDERTGNREKVEAACREIQKTSAHKMLVGFVDREFRDFDYAGSLVDRCPRHNNSDGIIWTRGHSIENYYFDIDLLNGTLGNFAKTIHFDEVLDLFSLHFEQTIRIACALSLASRDTRTLSILKERGRIEWDMFGFDRKNLTFDVERWRNNLLSSPKMNDERVTKVLKQYDFWLGKTTQSDFETVRWMCHGHIGQSCLFSVFGACIFEICRLTKQENPEYQVNKYLRVDEDFKFNALASAWVQKSISNKTIYPRELLQALQVI
jgi:hypothetical protein